MKIAFVGNLHRKYYGSRHTGVVTTVIANTATTGFIIQRDLDREVTTNSLSESSLNNTLTFLCVNI